MDYAIGYVAVWTAIVAFTLTVFCCACDIAWHYIEKALIAFRLWRDKHFDP